MRSTATQHDCIRGYRYLAMYLSTASRRRNILHVNFAPEHPRNDRYCGERVSPWRKHKLGTYICQMRFYGDWQSHGLHST